MLNAFAKKNNMPIGKCTARAIKGDFCVGLSGIRDRT